MRRFRRAAVLAIVMALLITGYCVQARTTSDTEDAGMLPRLVIVTDSGELPGDEDAPGSLRLTDNDDSGKGRVEAAVRIRLRGNTSRRFPKKSYRLKLVEGSGKKRHLSLCGLRADDDWILNPMYSDTSKVREALAYWLWEQINSQGSVAASSRLAYVELWLNGDYHGLYALQERVDRKQVGADKQRGILYKAIANDRPEPEKLLNTDDAMRCGRLELAFRGAAVQAPWAPAADYMALIEGLAPPGDSRLSRHNAVDYALWSMLVQARDNHFKNMFIHCVWQEGGYVMYRIPWDLNHTFGDLWDGESHETNYLTYAMVDLAMDDGIKALLEADPTMMNDMRVRWTELREETVTEKRITEQAHALFDGLYPAILRDTARWPSCGMGEGNAANIRDIEDYVRVTLTRMDGMLSN